MNLKHPQQRLITGIPEFKPRYSCCGPFDGLGERLEMKNELTLDRLRALLNYNEENGVFLWRVDRGARKLAGHKAGNIHPSGYVNIKIDGCIYGAHRLAWLYQMGSWPTNEIDHINGVRHANNFRNLRDVPAVVNMQNVRHVRANKKSSQLIGAVWCKRSQKWTSQLQMCGHRKHLGYFGSEVEAHTAYIEAKRIFHPGNTL